MRLYCRVLVREQAKAIITISRWQCFVGFQLWSTNFHTDRMALGGWYASVGGREVLLHKLMSSTRTHSESDKSQRWTQCWCPPPSPPLWLGFSRDVRVSSANILQVSVEELSRVLEQSAVTPMTALKAGKCKVCICVWTENQRFPSRSRAGERVCNILVITMSDRN